jgi:hypothetical protein
MSLFRWLFPEKKPVKLPESSGLSRPVRRGAGEPAGSQSSSRKNERMARRELLYGVVRDSMTRAGVLSASYKFKVLSLDPKGKQFLVMIDAARNYTADPARLAEIEAMIAQAAKARHDIMVTSVYWRTNEQVSVGVPQSRPAPLESKPAPLVSQPVPLATAPAKKRSPFEPIEADEVEAFKNALAAGTAKTVALPKTSAQAAPAADPARAAGARAFDGAAKSGPQSYTLLTGYEDTELPDPEYRVPVLSGTQYGDLN